MINSCDNYLDTYRPPRLFVGAAFGLTRLERPLGLYGVGTVGENIAPRNAVELCTLLDTEGALAGALFTFLGFRFFLNLQQGEVPRSFPLPSGEGWMMSSALYHIARLNSKVGKKLSHYIHFLWNLK